ncbi:MAG: hypothetical protein LBK60_01080 [Verrucomicrobiales bacterium]|jgi:hypothetical protein|nr:hypothetical protein [Verrucomicrobiales bacterium]
MSFNINHIQSVSFGVCLDSETEESYRIVPSEIGVQNALTSMLKDTLMEINKEGTVIEDFSPAEKYGATERLRVSLESEWVQKHKRVFLAENLSIDTHGLDIPSSLVSYFAIFHDIDGNKLMGFRRAAQFKGVVKKHLVTITNDALCLVADNLFKLDSDFDFLIFDEQILIWRPSGFIFTACMDEYIVAYATANVAHIAAEISCVNFSALNGYIAKHKLAMRLVAAIKSRNDLGEITKQRLRAECKDSGVKLIQKDGMLLPAEGSEMGFLMLLDRRRYTVMLVPKHPETYEAPSRHLATTIE